MPEPIVSPTKTIRVSGTDDATSLLPSLRSNRDRPSPATRKISGSGAPRERPSLDREENVFLAGSRATGSGNLTLGAHFDTPPSSRRRVSVLRSQSASPTPSPRHRIPEGLDTGHRSEVEVSDLEEGQILEGRHAPTNPLDTAVAGYNADAENAADDNGAPPTQPPAIPAPATDEAPDHNEPALLAVTPPAQEIDAANNGTVANAQAGEEQAPPAQDIAMGDARSGRKPRWRSTTPPPPNNATRARGPDDPFLVPMPAIEPAPIATIVPALDPGDPGMVGAGHPFIFANGEQAAAHGAAADPAPPMEDVQGEPAPPYAPADQEHAAMPQVYAPPIVIAPAMPAGADEAIAGAAVALAPVADAIAAAGGWGNLQELAAAVPTHRDENPHRKVPAVVQDDPMGPEDLGKVSLTAMNTGNYDELVCNATNAMQNLQPVILKEITDNPARHAFLMPFNGGKTLFTGIPDFSKRATDLLVSVVGNGNATVIPIGPDDPNLRTTAGVPGGYAGPLLMGIEFLDAGSRTKALAYRILAAADRTVAFWVIPTDHFRVTWTAGIWKVSIGEGSEAGRRALRHLIMELLRDDATLRRYLNQATAAFDRRPLDDRARHLALTADPVWNPLMQAFVLFLKPCTTNDIMWKKITDYIAGKTFAKGYYFFKPILDAHAAPGPRCVLCKNDTHFASGCPFPADPEWWGPPGQINTLTEGPLASKKKSEGTDRGRGRGGRGGNGRGGRGF
ncbi:hypothetical protein DFH07DRAFT_947906 [Mycena maculata]|uniref:Uncharacterized protein n=1 Tax=Mycena maculata TaxID=230809 RepID=A0AAD7KGQ1_9AGAR|nr:hypothetical protein DFH07DRAFT_947906 [Mycena maculata]